MKQDKDELLNCPFCGGKAYKASTGWVKCNGCNVKVGTCIEWNTRVPDLILGYSIEQIRKSINWCKQHGFDIVNDPELLRKPWVKNTQPDR